MSFQSAAHGIIKSSLRSAICIDDNYASAYTPRDTANGLNFDEPAELYVKFREEGCCDLDIFQYKSYQETWKKEHMLFNKDLLIIDWELDPKNVAGKYLDTIRILEDVVESNKIPFVVIYTNTEDLHEVDKALIANFNYVSVKEFEQKCKNAEREFGFLSSDKDSIDVEKTFDDLKENLYQYIHYFKQRKTLNIEITEYLIKSFQIKPDQKEKFFIKLKKIFSPQNSNNHFIFDLAISVLNENTNIHSINRIEIEAHSYKINGTIVIIYHKQKHEGGIKPNDLFSEFANAIVNNPYSYLSLLSLEFKDLLRENFSMIGTEFSRISEHAFLYHLNNYRKTDSSFDTKYIYDFILKSWISELYNQKMNEESISLSLLDERYNDLKEFIPGSSNETFLKELVRYSSFISNSFINNREDLTLRFGDLFFCKQNKTFFLCITPLCDCIRPKDKIDDNFYFVKGSIGNDSEALREAESGFYSFVSFSNETYSIRWKCKPFTVYIENNNINNLPFTHCGKKTELKHISVLKENYTQRIANQSFGYGFRVGVDLPHIKLLNDIEPSITSAVA
jgi:hypothetical protein